MEKIKLFFVVGLSIFLTDRINAQCVSTVNYDNSSTTNNQMMKWSTAQCGVKAAVNSIIFDNGINIGVGNTTPSYKLDVSGDINASTATGGFRIAGTLMLSKPGTSNTFVGNGAGSSNTGASNSFLGENAGFSNTSGGDNICIGVNAGYKNTTSGGNIMIGSSAGYSNTSGYQNTFIGLGVGYANTTGYHSTAIGSGALNVNTSGAENNAFGYQALSANTTAGQNDAFGIRALSANTTGSNNKAFGYNALLNNQTGSFNAAFGDNALYTSTVSNNNAFGYQSLRFNTTGTPNNAFGYEALYNNTTGSSNDAIGYQALYANTTGSYNQGIGNAAGGQNSTGNYNVSIGYLANYHNTASNNTGVGFEALANSTTGASGVGSNTGLGFQAGYTNTTGTYNTFLGCNADANASTYVNSIGVGYAAPVKASYYGVVGNSLMTSIGGYVGWTTYVSDSRCKKDVQANVPGLAFIKKLRPVTYHIDMDQVASINKTPDSLRTPAAEADKSKILYSGFIAQEVEKAAQQLNYDFSGNYIPENKDDIHGLRYAEFVMPLVKGMQEQQQMIEQQDSIITILQKQVNQLLANNGTVSNTSNITTTIGAQGVSLSNSDIVVLNQNVPNPFAEQTTITYVIPQSAGTAQIMFYDMSGKQVKSVNITTKGKGALTVYANDLTNGTYSYTLIVDGKIIDTKQMIKQQ